VQERMVRQVGGAREVPFDVRIIVATHRDLGEMVKQGTFREDLYYRLNVISMRMPPLRERGDDVLICAEHFVQQFAKAFGKEIVGLSPEVRVRLLAHSWPGNVRELQNTIERAVVFAKTNHITVGDLPEPLQRYRKQGRVREEHCEMLTLRELEQRHIAAVMSATGGNRTAAALLLGVDRRTLLRKEGQLLKAKDRPSATSAPGTKSHEPA
jgi:two-component system, NtrC family, response regulator AtoC